MPYSKFTLSKAVEDFHLTIVEGGRFPPDIPSVTPTPLLQDILKETIPWAIAVSSEKARSEGILLLHLDRVPHGCKLPLENYKRCCDMACLILNSKKCWLKLQSATIRDACFIKLTAFC